MLLKRSPTCTAHPPARFLDTNGLHDTGRRTTAMRRARNEKAP
ncbi:hypothetical protein BURMUCF2_A2143 [Burkholderia multivorans CF2]|nr:hypothetical protein BURMUCF2_A2143 [Burkholderia multivorans CF2]